MRAKFVNETFETPNENDLLPGERRALAQGLDVMSKSQLAAIYLAAKDALGRSEDTKGRGDTGLTRNAIKINTEIQNDFRKVPASRLADLLDLKPRTVSYTLSKYRLLLQGNREGTESNHLYDKLINAFDEFEKMPISEVFVLANEAINPNADFSRSEKFADEVSAQAKKFREASLKRDKLLSISIVNMFNSLKSHVGDEKAAKMALSKISTEKNIPIETLRTTIKTYLKNDPILARKF
jgi:hypothetical protein